MPDAAERSAPPGRWANLRALPSNFWRSLMRHGLEGTPRNRSLVVMSNVFLHVHSVHTHKHSLRWSYTFGLGLISLFLFAILGATGVILMMFYVPSTELAYDRIRDLAFVVTGGRFMRNLHRWTAHGMVVAVLLHMVRVFYTGAYKPPRELNWVVGMLLLVLTLGLSFTGYLLPWDQLAFWAITIGSAIAGSAREVTDALGVTQVLDVGGAARALLLGGTEIGQDALLRFYVLHVVVLPGVAAALLAVHVWRIRKDGGLSRPEEAPPAAAETESAGATRTYGLMALVKGDATREDALPENTVLSWPRLFIVEGALFASVLAAFGALSLVFDAPLKALANPSVPENPAKAPWYFLGLQELVSYSGFAGGVMLPGIAVLGLMLIPYLDREPGGVGTWLRDRSERREVAVSAAAAAAFIVGVLAITVRYGWLRSWFPGIPQLVITAVNPGTAIVAMFAAKSAWSVHRSGSTRLGAISLFTMFCVGFVILTYVGTFLRGPNWGFYWSQSDWPLAH
jgi:quinol-cytochrome oxidoreductase complex cytochrome b subunit